MRDDRLPRDDDDPGDDGEAIVMPRGKRDSAEMDITPMIDITFLLLIFFVVCSKMDPTQTGELPAAQHGLAVSAKDSAVIFIEPSGEDKAIFKRRDGSQFSEDEEQFSAEVVEYVERELEKSLDRNKNQVMLLGAPDVEVNHVTRVQQIIGDAFESLEFTYIAVKEN